MDEAPSGSQPDIAEGQVPPPVPKEEEGAAIGPHLSVHLSAKAIKSAQVRTTYDRRTGEVVERRLDVQTHFPGEDDGRTPSECSYLCDKVVNEADLLQAFLHDWSQLGEYRLIRRSAAVDRILQELDRGELATHDIARLVTSIRDLHELASELASVSPGQVLAEAIELHRRREALGRLRRVVNDPSSTELRIHRELKGQTWIFGGRYAGEAAKRALTTQDVVDIPLVRGDGSIHIVEIKKANVAKAAYRHRSHWILGVEVHEAVSQAENYLRSLDEKRPALLADHRIDVRRASAIVVVGHRRFIRGSPSAEELAHALRTYNSHLSRIQVMTYDELIEEAQRFLALSDSSVSSLDTG